MQLERADDGSGLKEIENCIHEVGGRRVILDADLARLYGVSTRRLNEQVSRNLERFPLDFMFELGSNELANLRSQIATSSSGHGGRRSAVRAFTEHGAIMAASVLRSDRAVRVSVQVVRAFVRLRQLLATHHDLACRVDELEARYDGQFRVVFDALRQLIAPPEAPARRIGFERSSEG